MLEKSIYLRACPRSGSWAVLQADHHSDGSLD
jgi:hypothetical protein